MDPVIPKPAKPVQSDGRVHGVVAAVMRDDGHLLLIRRSYTVAAPGKVCFPGGTVELGENLTAAMLREMREELGVQIICDKMVWEWNSPDRPLKLFGFVARIVAGKLSPDPDEVAEILWLKPHAAIHHPDAMPSNESFVNSLLAHLE